MNSWHFQTSFVKRGLVFIWLAVLFVALLPRPTGASTEFSYETDVTYTVSAEGTTRVTEVFRVRNNTSRLYLTQIVLSTPTDSVTGLVARYDDGGIIPTDIRRVDSKRGDVDTVYHEITLKFPRQISGQGRRWGFSVGYQAGGLFEARGGVRQLYIPYLDPADDRDKYTVRVDVPKSFGRPHFPAARAASGGETGDRQYYNFSREELKEHPLAVLVFGDKTAYDINFKYPLKNDGLLPRTFTVTLPPDLNNQKTYVNKLDPAPKSTRLDEDGNILAEYVVGPRSQLVVETDISVEVRYLEYDLGASGKAADIPSKLVRQYTGPSRYWQTDGAVADEAKKVTDPSAPVINNVRALHQLVIDRLKYNKDKIKFNIRQGAGDALADPNNVVCLEYADLLVAMLRSQGIPARMPIGYAFRADLKDSASVVDSLHAWVEAYVPGIGWMTLDPTWSEDNASLFGKTDLDHAAFAVWGLNDEAPESVMVGRHRTGYEYDQTEIKFREAVAAVEPVGSITTSRHALLPFVSLERTKLQARPQIASDDNRIETAGRTIELGSLAPGERVTVRRLVVGTGWNRTEPVALVSGPEAVQLAGATITTDYLPMAAIGTAIVIAAIVYYLARRRHRTGVELTEEIHH